MLKRLDWVDKDTINKQVGHRLDVLRKQLGYTREDIAQALDLQERQIGRKIRGESGFTVAQLIQIAALLAVDPAVLVSAIEEQPKNHHRALINILLDDLPRNHKKHLEALVALMLEDEEITQK